MNDIEKAAKQHAEESYNKASDEYVAAYEAFEEGAYYILEKAKKWLKNPENHEGCSLHRLTENFFEAMEG